MRPCLVVYYSRTGFTAKIAQEIAVQCGADIDVIREARGRAGPYGFLRSVVDSVLGREPPILAPEKDPADYAMVILGTPVWAGHVCAPMRTYLRRHQGRFHQVGLFCTMGSKGRQQAFDEMTALCGKIAVAAVSIPDADIRDGHYRTMLGALNPRAYVSPN